MANTQFMKRAIADYLQGALASADSLNAVKLFIRGGTPMPVPSDHWPFIEIIIGQEDEGDEMTGNEYSQVYVGLLTVNVQLTAQASADWLAPISDRYVTLPSYDQVEELVTSVLEELQKAEHRDLGGLIVGDEAVTSFRLTGPRVYGLDQDARTNNYENFGSIPFEVETERRQ